MRLKVMERPLSIYNNGNNNNNTNILNSPKRLNTIQNCNIATNNYNNKQLNLTSTTTTTTIKTKEFNEDVILKELTRTYNNINKNQSDTVQWCNRIDVVNGRELQNDNQTTITTTNKEQLYNINNSTTLAVSLKEKRFGTVSSICSESSPDDSLLEYEDSHHSGASSAATTPQDEDRIFDVIDGETYLTDDCNSLDLITEQRGIVNPNYPGFQHLAHTLDYTIKVTSSSSLASTSSTSTSSDAELSEDEAIDPIAIDNDNNNNNNNINGETEEDCRMLDQIDNVNRLDSFENVQKVFYDKPVLNLTLDHEETLTLDHEESLTTTAEDTNLIVDDKIDINNLSKVDLNLKEELEESVDKLKISKELTPSTTNTTASGYNIVQAPNMTATVASVHTNQMFSLNMKDMSTTYTDIEESYVSDSINLTLDTSFFKETIYDKICEKFRANFTKNRDGSDVMMLEDGTCYNVKFSDAFLSGIHDTVDDLKEKFDEKLETIQIMDNDAKSSIVPDEKNKTYCKEDLTKEINEKDEDGGMVPRKKEKMDTNRIKKRRDLIQQNGCTMAIQRRDNNSRNHHHKHHHHHHHHHHRDNLNRRSLPINGQCDMNDSSDIMETFDVYNIETAMPKIDLDAIECHLRAAREEERRRRTDREEIRRRLAMGNEDDFYNNCDRPGRKPSLQARLQSGMNLQICFMNETASDTESPSSDSECPMTNPKQAKSLTPKILNEDKQTEKLTNNIPIRPATLSIGQPLLQPMTQPMNETDFFTRQARLQTEARMALAQAKEMARMQMEIERQRQKKSPITEMVRNSLEKVGIQFPEDRRRLSRQILTEMNVAQLQVIVNDLHTQIETLNEKLVQYLMDRDDLHMEQDSMLVDIEDLTRFLGAKEQIKEKNVSQNNNVAPPSPAPSSPLAAALNSSVKPHFNRIANLVKK